MDYLNYWGAVFLLHPFILRISSFRTRISGGVNGLKSNNDWYVTETLQNGRMGKDSFFFFAVILAVLLFKGTRNLPKFETFTILSLCVMNFFNQYDFLSPSAMYQSSLFFVGLLFFKHLMENYSESFRDYLMAILAISCVIHSEWVFLESFNVNLYAVYADIFLNVKAIGSHGIDGVLGNSNVSGAYIALTAPLLTRFSKYYLLFPVIALVLLGAVMPMITFAAFFSYYAWVSTLKDRIIPFIGVSLAMIAAYFLMFTESNMGPDSGRFIVWSKTFLKLDWFTFFGNGLGYYADVFPEKFKAFGVVFRHPHNEVISIFLSQGIVGSLLAGAILFKGVMKSTVFMASCLFAVFVNSLGNFTFHTSTVFAVCALYLVFALNQKGRA